MKGESEACQYLWKRVPGKYNAPEARVMVAILRGRNKAWRRVSMEKNGRKLYWGSSQGLGFVGPYIGHCEDIRFLL